MFRKCTRSTCLNPLGGESSSATPSGIGRWMRKSTSLNPLLGESSSATSSAPCRYCKCIANSLNPLLGESSSATCVIGTQPESSSPSLNPLLGESSSATAPNLAIESRAFKGFGRVFFRNAGLCFKRAGICEVCRLSIRFVVVAGHHIPPKTQRRPLADLHHLAEPEQRP